MALIALIGRRSMYTIKYMQSEYNKPKNWKISKEEKYLQRKL